MISLDTNILTRFFINDVDDPEAIKQQIFAKRCMAMPVEKFVTITVILEFVWVAKKFYQLPREDVAKILLKLCHFRYVTVEFKAGIEQTVTLYLEGMDFADALHLVRSSNCQQFCTFDQKFIKKAKKWYPSLKILSPNLL